jgi:hypothetical protein
MEANGVTPMPAAIATACGASKMCREALPYGPSMWTTVGRPSWSCAATRSSTFEVQLPRARMCTLSRFFSSGALVSVNGCHSCRATAGMRRKT